MSYLKLEDIVPGDFLRKPRTLIVEAGNGFGKTHSMSLFVSLLQPTRMFERIYFLEYSQKACENVVNKIVRFGGKVVWHIGIDHYCNMGLLLDSMRELGIPSSYACYMCPFFKNKQKLAFTVFREMMENPNVKVVKPTLHQRGLDEESKVCTQPIIRSYVLSPSFSLDYYARIDYTPIIVTPSQLMLNHMVVGKWIKYSRRQRRERKSLMVIDEADTVFYSSLKINIPEIPVEERDIEILREFSSRRRDLSKLADYYHRLRRLLRQVVDNLSFPRPEHLTEFREIQGSTSKLISSFDYRRKEILHYILSRGEPTNVFRLANVFYEVNHILNPEYALSTVEEENGTFILEDYDFGVKSLLDNTFPWRSFWKVLLSATFPTEKVAESRLLSFRGKAVLLSGERKTKTYSNVYVSIAPVFPEGYELLNRNYEIEHSIPKLLNVIKRAIRRYRELFKRKPRGVCVWLGNKKQYRTVVEAFKRLGFTLKIYTRYSIVVFPGITIFISYVGSPVARGIDLDKYDISIAVSPLLRPPRNLVFLDVVDFARAVAETIQSVMRIVRSPSPPNPKLVVLEKSITKSFYSFFYPEWFKQLLSQSYVEL